MNKFPDAIIDKIKQAKADGVEVDIFKVNINTGEEEQLDAEEVLKAHVNEKKDDTIDNIKKHIKEELAKDSNLTLVERKEAIAESMLDMFKDTLVGVADVLDIDFFTCLVTIRDKESDTEESVALCTNAVVGGRHPEVGTHVLTGFLSDYKKEQKRNGCKGKHSK